MWGTSSQGIAALLDFIQDLLVEQDLSGLSIQVENPHLTERAGGWQRQPHRHAPQQVPACHQTGTLAVEKVAYLVE